ncbi:hypothetical protein [uncultured Microscilla sp.]|uniref:hypothetical protein n=1 Tax=uncultured Microscilla sp. TaxID=432653 RepID=UPI00260FA515|nr:hypothetical protein [uncultured Microscilla sp.]
MSKNLLPLILLLFITQVSFAQKKWRRYKSKPGNFKVKLPVKPTLKERKDQYIVEAESEGVLYQILFNKTRQNNDLKVAQKLVSKELDKVRRDLRLKEELRIESNMGTLMLGLPVQGIRFRNQRNQLYQYRVLVTKYHTYHFIITKYNKILDKARSAKFFGSFKLWKKEK